MKNLNNHSIQLPHYTERKLRLTKVRLSAKMVTALANKLCVCACVCKAQLVRISSCAIYTFK